MVAKKKTHAVSKKKPTASKKKTGHIKIKFKCNGLCKVTRKHTHMSPGNQVEMDAINIDVRIVFLTGSPFESGKGYPASNPIVISKGTSDTEKVSAGANGHYQYTYTCTNPLCATPVEPPDMIVP
jgi:hypothetical protein